jgi:hypothetical protein
MRSVPGSLDEWNAFLDTAEDDLSWNNAPVHLCTAADRGTPPPAERAVVR